MGDSKIKAQVVIEFTLTLFCLFVFLVATAKIFAWCTNNIIQRHKAYEATRTDAGHSDKVAASINFYTPKKLDIFSDWDISDWKNK